MFYAYIFQHENLWRVSSQFESEYLDIIHSDITSFFSYLYNSVYLLVYQKVWCLRMTKEITVINKNLFFTMIAHANWDSWEIKCCTLTACDGAVVFAASRFYGGVALNSVLFLLRDPYCRWGLQYTVCPLQSDKTPRNKKNFIFWV